MMMHHSTLPLEVPVRALSAGMILAFFAAMLMPSMASAATFAYVDRQGEVVTTIAQTAMEALMTAPNVHIHSGVMLIDSAADSALVGDHVAGM